MVSVRRWRECVPLTVVESACEPALSGAADFVLWLVSKYEPVPLEGFVIATHFLAGRRRGGDRDQGEV